MYLILVLYLSNYWGTYHRSLYVVQEQYMKGEQKYGLFAQSWLWKKRKQHLYFINLEIVAIYGLYDGRKIMLLQMQQMLMSIKWQRFVERRDSVIIFQPKKFFFDIIWHKMDLLAIVYRSTSEKRNGGGQYLHYSLAPLVLMHACIHNWLLQPFSQDYWPCFSRHLGCVC